MPCAWEAMGDGVRGDEAPACWVPGKEGRGEMIEETAARQCGRLSDAPFLALGEDEREWTGGGRRLL